MFRSSKLFIVLLVLILATAAFAFAAQNTMPLVTVAGEGAQTISGYDVQNVNYNLNTAVNPSLITSVDFDLVPAAPLTLNVTVQLDSTGGAFYSCTSGDGTNWSCDTTATAIDVPTADRLRVITLD